MVIRFFYVLFSLILIAGQVSGQEKHLRRSIYFPGGQYYITPNQLIELRSFLDSIPDLQQFDITIHSHTDNIGGIEYNQWLAEMRSYSAMHELIINNSIQQESISIKDFGQHNPVYDNTTNVGRQMNRRVDIILWPVSF